MGMSKVGYVTDATWVLEKELRLILGILERQGLWPRDFCFTSGVINLNPKVYLHRDANNFGPTFVLGLGGYTGGEFVLKVNGNHMKFDIKERPLLFDGRLEHGAQDFSGDRITILLYSHVGVRDIDEKTLQDLRELGFRLPPKDAQLAVPTAAWRPCARPLLGKNPIQQLTALLHRRATHRGGEVRLPLARLGHPGLWPPKALAANWFKWEIALAYKMVGEHINVLELRAYLAAVKWRLRKGDDVGRIFLHMMDSQVCIAAAAKGRSSSRALNRVLHRLNCLLLANGSFALLAYLHTKDNPADRPSRWGGGQ